MNVVQKTQTNAASAPQPTVEAPSSGETETGSSRSSVNLFRMGEASKGQAQQNKQAFMGDIRQKLAQVADTAKSAGETASETETLADMSATRLYEARINGVISGEELSGLLVDVFGAVPKQDGTPGKSPAGAGKTIRQRIVRAVQGHDWLNGGDGGRFFDSLDKEEVAPIINNIGKVVKNDAGEVIERGPSIWNAYKLLGDVKSQSTVRVPFAFDPKKIVGLTESLSEAGARDALLSNPSLLKAYGGLFDQLQVLSTVDDSEVAEVSAKLGISPSEADEQDEDEAEVMAA